MKPTTFLKSMISTGLVASIGFYLGTVPPPARSMGRVPERGLASASSNYRFLDTDISNLQLHFDELSHYTYLKKLEQIGNAQLSYDEHMKALAKRLDAVKTIDQLELEVLNGKLNGKVPDFKGSIQKLLENESVRNSLIKNAPEQLFEYSRYTKKSATWLQESLEKSIVSEGLIPENVEALLSKSGGSESIAILENLQAKHELSILREAEKQMGSLNFRGRQRLEAAFRKPGNQRYRAASGREISVKATQTHPIRPSVISQLKTPGQKCFSQAFFSWAASN